MKQILFFCLSGSLFLMMIGLISVQGLLLDVDFLPSFLAQESIPTQTIYQTGSDTDKTKDIRHSPINNTTINSSRSADVSTNSVPKKSEVSTSHSRSEGSSGVKALSPLDRQNLESIRKSLEKQQKFPWYSNENGQLKFLPPHPEKLLKNTSTSNNSSNWNKIFNSIFWMIMIVIFIFLIVAVVLVFFHLKGKKTNDQSKNTKLTDDLRRQRESLPTEVAQQIGFLDLLAESSIKEGDFRKAIIYHFSWLLVELDQRKIIHLQKEKTNRQLLSEIKFREDLTTLYRHVMNLFEKTYYGTQPISKEDLLSVWQEKDLLSKEMNKPIQNPAMFPSRKIDHSQQNFHSFFLIVLTAAVSCLISCAGCKPKYWSDKYTINYSSKSINDISIFCDMIKSRDHEITINKRSCDNPNDYDVIFWFSFIDSSPCCEGQKLPACFRWLEEKKGRKLFLVLNDVNSDYDFWNDMQKFAPSDQLDWVKEKIQNAKYSDSLIQKNYEQIYNRNIKEIINQNKNIFLHNKKDNNKTKDNSSSSSIVKTKKKHNNSDSPESSIPGVSQKDLAELHEILISDLGSDSKKWLTCKPLKKVETSSILTGASEWAGGLEPEFPYRFTRKIEFGPDYKILVAAGGIPLITKTNVGQSDLYVISSRLFLLNYPLIKKDRQILAGRLINSLGSKPRNILFAFNEIYFHSRKNSPKPLPAIFSTKPFAILFWHLVFFSVLLTFRVFPILGRPREIPPEERADFSKHLTAFATLLERTGNRAWAEKNIDLYLKQKENEQTKQ